jgi:hypothetical protein
VDDANAGGKTVDDDIEEIYASMPKGQGDAIVHECDQNKQW